MVGKNIKVTATDEDGNVLESLATAAVTNDVVLPDDQIEGAIKIEDISGLQSDGTGLVGDWLRAVVPATLGSFSNVIFYRDGVQLNSTTMTGAAMAARADRPGLYTVSVIGTDNKVYLSDSIEVVDTEAPAVITAVSIEDDYATPKIIVDTEDTEAVISVTLNKAYNGNIRVFKASDLKYTGAAVVSESTVVTQSEGDGTAITAGSVIDTNSLWSTARVAAAADGAVARYVDPNTGATTYKFTVAATAGEDIVRGTEYKVIFDQTSITSDTAGMGSENVGPNTITAPYLEVPASMSIVTAPNGQAVKLSFVGASGETMSWMGNPNGVAANTFLTQLKVFSDTNSDLKDGTDLSATAAGSTVLKGIVTTNALADGNAFYYATAKTISGLFGAKSIDIASTLGTAAQEAATAISIGQDSSDPYTAEIKFENLRADGTVYVLQSYDPTTLGATNDKLISDFNNGTITAKASEKVTKGTASVKIAGAIDAITTNKNHYMALLVPDDELNYSQVGTTTGTTHGTVIASKLKSFKIVGVGKNVAGQVASYTTTAAFDATADTAILGYDQFGDPMATTAITEATTAKPMTCSNPTVAVDPATATEVTVTASTYDSAADGADEPGYGSLTINAGGTTVNKGEKWTLTLSTGQTLTIVAEGTGFAAANTVAKAAATWTVSIS